jgi:hypothetical protein
VRQFTVDYLSALKGPGGLTAQEAARLLMREQPDMPQDEFECRLGELLLELVPEEEGNAYLKQMLRTLQIELELHLADVEQREARQRQYRRLKAEVDTSREGQNVNRYASAAQREHHAALRQLRALQAERRKHGEGAVEEDPATTPETPAEPSGEVMMGPEIENQNSAKLPQVTGTSAVGQGGLDVSAPRGGAASGPGEVGWSEEPTGDPGIPVSSPLVE